MEMGKRIFWTGIVLGAVAGGLTALLDKDARHYVKDTVSQAKSTTRFYINNPSEAVSSIRKTVNMLNENLGKGAVTAMDALEKLEQSLDEKHAENDIKIIDSID